MRPFPRIPAKLLHDVAPNGAVHTIVTKANQVKKRRDLKRIEWANPASRRLVRTAVVAHTHAQ